MAAKTSRVMKVLIAAIVIIIATGKRSSSEGLEVYFPISSVKLNLPINEKSQSIFSKIPIGRFQVVAVANNTVAPDYLYTLEQNELLRVNGTTGEIFMKNDYRNVNANAKFLLTAIHRNASTSGKVSHMSLELNPMDEGEYCKNLKNVCFWEAAHYTIVEDLPKLDANNFRPRLVGALNPRASRYLCPTVEIKYALENGSKFFALNNNALYTRALLDYESINSTDTSDLKVNVTCVVKLDTNELKKYTQELNIRLLDRNDNGPVLQNDNEYSFALDDPHFKADEPIGEKIIFTDKDAVQTNAHLSYLIHNDTNDLVRPACNAYETDHTGKRNSIISCQIVFARSGILSQSPYCFTLEAIDETTDASATQSADANICIHTDPSKIHQADRPQALALRQHRNKMSRRIFNTDESMLENEGNEIRRTLSQNIFISYPKDVFVYRTSISYYRVAQPDNMTDSLQKSAVRFAIAEDRSGAFGITPEAGIVYVRDMTALERSPETVYFLNITWHDTHQHFFVMNLHLVEGRPDNATCEHKIKSRSQTCAQIKYQKQCVKFCGLATNGGGCIWRGSNGGFGSNYASCVPDAKYCPDNVCDPLEELNTYACPQDCTPWNKIFGPHSVNDNKHGILSASGTCTCEDNGKCSCAPMEDNEPRPKRKRKNETKIEDVMELGKLGGERLSNDNVENGVELAGFVCGKSCMVLAIACPLVIVMLIACLIVSRRNLKLRRLGKEVHSTQKTLHSHDGECDVRNGDLPLMQLENGFKFDADDTKWEFERAKLVLDAVLGEGEFGKVVKGYATDIAGIPGVTTVAVKMLKNGANSAEYMALLSEFQLLQEVSHPNVIKLLGACTKGESPMIIIEYARYGSLRSYLRLSRKIECAGVDFSDGVEPITVKNILSFAWQICKGMAYLTEIKLVHRDLAARNVLLADGKICKISDFGLTRDVYEDDAYLKRSRDRVPVKWMAPESLADHVYTTKSDVWAFGVLCWELITLGASPYPGVPPQNLYHLLKTGYRMERPENCSEEIYSIVRTCWTDDPNARPSFKYLASEFEKLLGNNAKYIEMESNAISNPIYCTDEAKLASDSQSDLAKLTDKNIGEPDCLDHLWVPPKINSESHEFPNSRDFSTNFSVEFQPPPGYDLPRPLIEASSTEQNLRYENDLRFPLHTRKSVCSTSIASNSQNGSKGGVTEDHYSVPVKRGRSYMDMTNKSFIPDNLDGNDFEKHLSKTISFRFSSLLNLKEQDAKV